MLLVILDGWGHTENTEHNAIYSADTPVWDRLWAERPHTLINTSGADVGLPAAQMGNSEVGHLNLGAGRVVFQEYTRVSGALEDGSFFHNPVLTRPVDRAAAEGKAVHVMGLLSSGGVHSHERQLHAMVELAVRRGADQVYLHAFLDGRDSPPCSAARSIAAMEQTFARLGVGRFASLVGRYYAMDRDHRWKRTRVAYELIAEAQSTFEAPDASAGLEMAYAREETDEFVQPTRIVPAGAQAARVEDGDAVFFMNYRADRARQLTRAFIDADFDGFERRRRPAVDFVTLTEYNSAFDVAVAYPPERPKNGLGEFLAARGLRQLRVAETEKYAHVTFFLNGGREEPFEGEDRILVPSPKVATYDLQPEMSAPQVTDRLIAAIESGRYDVIICNYANPDMVGHTGNFEAAVRAIEALDACLGRLCEAATRAGGELLVTADHGNAERMRDPGTGQAHTAHTTNLVPLIYVGRPARMGESGALADLAPTLLHLMGIEPPAEMTGRRLVHLDAGQAATS